MYYHSNSFVQIIIRLKLKKLVNTQIYLVYIFSQKQCTGPLLILHQKTNIDVFSAGIIFLQFFCSTPKLLPATMIRGLPTHQWPARRKFPVASFKCFQDLSISDEFVLAGNTQINYPDQGSSYPHGGVYEARVGPKHTHTFLNIQNHTNMHALSPLLKMYFIFCMAFTWLTRVTNTQTIQYNTTLFHPWGQNRRTLLGSPWLSPHSIEL